MSNQVDLSRLDETEVEEVRKYLSSTYGLPRVATFPEGWDLLAALDSFPEEGDYRIEVLDGGMQLGNNWRLLPQRFSNDLVARAHAFTKTVASKHPSRVLLLVYRKGRIHPISDYFTICTFYEKDDKTFIVIRVSKTLVVEQEVLFEHDITGGELTVKEVPEDE